MNGLEGLLAGRTLADRYRVEAVIGRGGMGAVYRATDLRLGRPVAVKVISVPAPVLTAQPSLRQRFHREARAAAGIRHPNVVAVYDFGTDDALGLDYLVMELLRGEDLAARLARGSVPSPAASLALLEGAARGIGAGHRAGLIHRDVKPGNLFLEPGERQGETVVRVLDFGIVELTADEDATELTGFGTPPYSPAYASPEQLRGDRRLTPASDVFSLGAVGFHLLAGERAFRSADPGRMAAELSTSLASLYARTPLLTPAVRATLARALAPDPAARFHDGGAFAAALAAAERGEAPAPAVWTGEQTVLQAGAQGHEEDRTQLLEPDAERPGARREDPLWQPSPPASSSAPLEIRVERRRGFRHVVRRTWDFFILGVSLALGIGSWTLAIHGLLVGDPWQLYSGGTAATLFTPLAVARLWNRPGRYPLALACSLVITALALILLGPRESTATVLAAALGGQLLTSAAIVAPGRRRSEVAVTALDPEPGAR